MRVFIFLFSIFMSSCMSDSAGEPLEKAEWAKIKINGNEKSFEFVRYIARYEYTAESEIQLTLYNGLRNKGDAIDIYFSIPEKGLEVNQAYPLKKGLLYEIEEMQTATLIVTKYDDTEIRGTLEFTSLNPVTKAFSTAQGEFKRSFY